MERMDASSESLAFDPLDPDVQQCPHPHHARLRAEAPVHYVADRDLFYVTTHELVLEVIKNPDVFSSRFPRSVVKLSPDEGAQAVAAMQEGLPRTPAMINADGEVHARYRRLVSKAFTPRSIAAMEPVVRAIAARLIEGFGRDVEFVGEFCVPLPTEVIAKALNVPDDRLADFKRWSDDTVVGFGSDPPIEERLRAIRGVNELQQFFVEAIEDRRAEPQDDLLTGLLEARVENDRPLDVPEVVGVVQQLLVAGNETTTKLLAEMARLLADHPAEWEAINEDPNRIPAVAEEALRLASPANAMWRQTTEDVVLGGTEIPKGARVVIAYSSANRDEEVFEGPEHFDPSRAALTDHLAFGHGIHFCLGASLARLEARVAFEELATRLDRIELLDTNDYPYNDSFLLRGLTRLDLRVR